MNECDKIRLQKNQSSLLDDLSVDDVLVHLIQEDIITDDDAERIKSEKTRRDRVQKLLSLLPYRYKQVFTVISHFRSKFLMKEPVTDETA